MLVRMLWCVWGQWEGLARAVFWGLSYMSKGRDGSTNVTRGTGLEAPTEAISLWVRTLMKLERVEEIASDEAQGRVVISGSKLQAPEPDSVASDPSSAFNQLWNPGGFTASPCAWFYLSVEW